MIRTTRAILAAATLAIAAVAAPATASAADLIVNGSFSSDLSGWTKVGPLACTYDFSTTPAPGMTGGYASSNAGSGSTCELYQTVSIPAGTTNSLTLKIGVTGSGPAIGDMGSLEIRDAAGALLQTLYSHNGTQGLTAAAPIGPFDLSAYAGQTIRIQFSSTHSSAPYVHVIDDVILNSTVAAPAAVPTMSEWAMILLGVLLVGGAALTIQRRRLTA